jgi:hypothetical protein
MGAIPPYTFDNDTWEEWFVQVSLGCDKRLQEGIYDIEDQCSLMQLYCNLLNTVYSSWTRTIDNRLDHIDNPYVAYRVWMQYGFPDGPISHALEAQPSSVWRGPIWDQLLESSEAQFTPDTLSSFPILIAAIRESLAHGSLKARENLVDAIVHAAGYVCNGLIFGTI